MSTSTTEDSARRRPTTLELISHEALAPPEFAVRPPAPVQGAGNRPQKRQQDAGKIPDSDSSRKDPRREQLEALASDFSASDDNREAAVGDLWLEFYAP
jgi:hypothetical protein